MSNTETTVAIHPIVILSISEFFNRMNMNFQSQRVFGGLIGEYSGNKVELFSSFEFLDKSYCSSKDCFVDLDLLFLKERRRITEQLYPNYDFVGFFSVGDNELPDAQDKEVVTHLLKFGVVNPLLLTLSSNLLDKEVLPIKVFSYDKQQDKFIQVIHDIVGYDSERICIDTVTKSGGAQNNDSQISQNMETLRSALSMLKSNLKTILKEIDKDENKKDPNFALLVNDILANHPNSSDPDLKKLIENSMEEMLILNNITCCSVGINYASKI
jgi:hypothetical protein